jgi:opacity protein-like surface antigen
MKSFVKFGVIASFILSSNTFAVNPVPGFYGGLYGGLSNGPSSRDISFTFNGTQFFGTIDNSVIGGGAAAYIGYRLKILRAEAEILYNRFSYGNLVFGNCTLNSPNIPPNGQCPTFVSNNLVGFSGSTWGVYGFFNGYIDFLLSSDDSTALAPYIGVGIGYAKITNSPNFVNVVQTTSFGGNVSASTSAAQGIIGIAYWIDDYVNMAMDYRYITTNNLVDFANSRYAINTFNISVNFAFDNS